MRHLAPVIGLAGVLLLSGCADSKWSIFRPSHESVQLPATQPPDVPGLVRYLNNNAALIQSLKCANVDLDCKQGLQQFHIRGKLACQKPRNFRMLADALGNTEADVGSNDKEFWYWIRRGDPYLIHCSYQDLANGVRIPFPFQPDWVMEALGMSEYDPKQDYKLNETRTTYELVQNTKNSQGRAVRKVTVFNKLPSAAPAAQVTDHYLTDASGTEICRARISDVGTFTVNGGRVVLPRHIVFNYPAERLTLAMTLWHRTDDVVVNPYFDSAQLSSLFTRPVLSGVQDYDLAGGMTGTSQVRPAGGVERSWAAPAR
jgi:hypothetical protein